MKKIVLLSLFLSASSVEYASQPLVKQLQQSANTKQEEEKKQKEALKKGAEDLVEKAHKGDVGSILAVYDFCRQCKKPTRGIMPRSSRKALRSLGLIDSNGKIDTWKASQGGVYDIMQRFLTSMGIEIV